MADKEIKCPCGYREYMEEHNCEKTDCEKCCPLSLQEIINRQQAKIERLKNDLAISRKETKRYATRRTEAIKEFAERLIYEEGIGRGDDRTEIYICEDDVLDIVKEMVGEQYV